MRIIRLLREEHIRSSCEADVAVLREFLRDQFIWVAVLAMIPLVVHASIAFVVQQAPRLTHLC